MAFFEGSMRVSIAVISERIGPNLGKVLEINNEKGPHIVV